MGVRIEVGRVVGGGSWFGKDWVGIVGWVMVGSCFLCWGSWLPNTTF